MATAAVWSARANCRVVAPVTAPPLVEPRAAPTSDAPMPAPDDDSARCDCTSDLPVGPTLCVAAPACDSLAMPPRCGSYEDLPIVWSATTEDVDGASGFGVRAVAVSSGSIAGAFAAVDGAFDNVSSATTVSRVAGACSTCCTSLCATGVFCGAVGSTTSTITSLDRTKNGTSDQTLRYSTPAELRIVPTTGNCERSTGGRAGAQPCSRSDITATANINSIVRMRAADIIAWSPRPFSFSR